MEKKIYHIMGYKKGSFSCKYLGIELAKGVKSNKVWYNIMEKLEARIGCWKDKWLTKVRKSTKIRLVLSTIPPYPLSCLPLPKLLHHKLKSKLRNFLWNDCEEFKKLAIIKWDNSCRPKEHGGSWIKNLQWKNEALGAKLIWCLYTKIEHKWAKIMYNKYLKEEDLNLIFKMKTLARGSESWNFIVNCHHLFGK